MIKQIELYKIYPVNADIPLNDVTVTSSGLSVYFNHSILVNNRTELYNAFNNNLLISYATDGSTILSVDEAVYDMGTMCDMAMVNDLTKYTHQVRWNLEIAPQLIASVRGEMLATDLSAIGLSGPALLGKLSSVIGAVQVGMFKEAWQMLTGITRDAFLDETRVTRYIDKLKSADAIIYV